MCKILCKFERAVIGAHATVSAVHEARDCAGLGEKSDALPWTAIACVMTSLMAPMLMLRVIGPAPSLALALPKSMKSCLSSWPCFSHPSRALSIFSVVAFDRLGAFPTARRGGQ